MLRAMKENLKIAQEVKYEVPTAVQDGKNEFIFIGYQDKKGIFYPYKVKKTAEGKTYFDLSYRIKDTDRIRHRTIWPNDDGEYKDLDILINQLRVKYDAPSAEVNDILYGIQEIRSDEEPSKIIETTEETVDIYVLHTTNTSKSGDIFRNIYWFYTEEKMVEYITKQQIKDEVVVTEEVDLEEVDL